MKLANLLGISALAIATISLTPGKADAIGLPDNSSCNTTGANGCFKITNTSTGSSSAVYGDGSTNNAGVVGTSTSNFGVQGSSTNSLGVYAASSSYYGLYANGGGGGLWAQSANGIGILASSSNSDGLRASTGAANMGAAAVSALSPDNNGLAYWGTGNIIITGSTAQKAGGGSWSSPSDARIKKDVKTLDVGLAELKKVRPVSFKYNGLGGSDNNGREYVGVIAQELEKVLPGMVSSRRGKLRPTDAEDTEIRIVDPSTFTYVLINAVQEQQRIIERQEGRIASLERGRAPVMSSLFTGGVGMGAAVGLLPVGLIVAIRRRRHQKA